MQWNLKWIMNIQWYSLLHYANLLTWYLKRTHTVQKYKNPVKNIQIHTVKGIQCFNKTSHNANTIKWPWVFGFLSSIGHLVFSWEPPHWWGNCWPLHWQSSVMWLGGGGRGRALTVGYCPCQWVVSLTPVSCLHILATASSISGSGWQSPAGHCSGRNCGGVVIAVPRLLAAQKNSCDNRELAVTPWSRSIICSIW